VESIFLTGTTLKMVGMDDMGENNLYKKIDSETLLHDIQFRGAISDFHSIKAKISKCDYDPITVRYNHDDKYGDGNNFELCLLKATADAWQETVDNAAKLLEEARLRAEREALEAEEAKKNKRKRRPAAPWKSLGSEVEIEAARAKPTREPLVVQISRRRREFKAPYKFTDKDSQELWNSSQMECRPFKDPNFELRRMEHDMGIQAVAEDVDACVQATNNMSRTGATQYEPLQMTEEEAQERADSQQMAGFLESITDRYEYALQQNEVMNIFEDAYASLAEEDGAPGDKNAKQQITPFQSFTDLTYSKGKRVKAIAWLPKKKGVVAVACTQPLTFDERLENAGRVHTSAILIWNFIDPIHPQFVLEAPFDVFCFAFNPKRPEIVTGGLYNGQIIFWNTSSLQAQMKKKEKQTEIDDTSETQVPTVKFSLLSAVENSHNGTVTDLVWLPEGIEVSKPNGSIQKSPAGDCNQFVTFARDGKVLFWDMRVKKDPKKGEIVWTPIYSVTLTRLEIAGDLAGVCFSFSFLDGLQPKMFATSMDGEVAYAEFVKPPEIDHPEFTKMNSHYHYGPVIAIQRSPFFEDTLLTVGDWTFKIWKEGHSMPIFSSGCADQYLSAGCWSPTRPGVIYTAKEDGNLEVWDLLDRSHEASVVKSISSSTIQSMEFWPTAGAQQLLAVGDGQGVLHILEMPRNLRRPVPNEKETMRRFFDREMQRVEYVLARQKVRAAEEKESEARKNAEKAEGEKKEVNKKDQDKWDAKEEAEYVALEREFKIQLGIIKEDDP